MKSANAISEPTSESHFSTEIFHLVLGKSGMAFFHHNGCTYLLLVDYYSKFIDVKKKPITTASAVIAVLEDVYARYGILSELVSDQGPPIRLYRV